MTALELGQWHVWTQMCVIVPRVETNEAGEHIKLYPAGTLMI